MSEIDEGDELSGSHDDVSHRPTRYLSQSALALPGPSKGRQPRSRKNRPCDHCRRSKTRCAIGESGPPCTSCRDTGRSCTFDFAPPTRPNPKSPRTHRGDSTMSRGQSGLEEDLDRDSRAEGSVRRSLAGEGRCEALTRVGRAVSITQKGSRRVDNGLDVLTSAVPSFDHLASSRYDPHVLTVVLTDDLLPIADPTEKMAGHGEPHVKQISSDPARPIFVIMNPKPDTSQQPIPGAVGLGLIRTFLRHHPTDLPESTLIELYHQHVHPALPILLQTTEDPLPLSLLAMVIATSMSHSIESRSIAAATCAILEAGSTPLPENNLAGVASACLELGIRPINSSRASYILLAKSVALAQLLGLHLDPSRWAIPTWEKDLRIRLWWVLAVHDAWMSFLNSRPALIQANNNSTPLPTFASLVEASCAYGSASTDSAKAFISACKLALLVRRLQSRVCTLDVVAQQSSEERRAEVSAIVKKVDALHDEWQSRLQDASKAKPAGVNSVLIHLLGLRCMLRRIHLELKHGLGSTFTPDAQVLAPFTDCVRFVESLTGLDCDGYYLNYASHILSSVTSSLTRLTLADPSSPNATAMDLLGRLIRALHRFHTDYKWDIASPALIRAAAVEARLISIGEHDAVVTALQGGEAAIPLDISAALQSLNAVQQTAVRTEPQLVWDLSGMDWSFGDLLGETDTGILGTMGGTFL